MQREIDKIIEVAKALNQTGTTACSTGERIAAAFVLSRLSSVGGGICGLVQC